MRCSELIRQIEEIDISINLKHYFDKYWTVPSEMTPVIKGYLLCKNPFGNSRIRHVHGGWRTAFSMSCRLTNQSIAILQFNFNGTIWRGPVTPSSDRSARHGLVAEIAAFIPEVAELI